jgi:hypothetical protein
VGDDESTPTDMAEADELMAMMEIEESKVLFTEAGALSAGADILKTFGFDDAAKVASAAAATTHADATRDLIQGMDLATAAGQWREVADDLKQQAKAQGGAYAADAEADYAEDELKKDDLSERERTDLEVGAAQNRATQEVLSRRAEELGDSAKTAAESAQDLERVARDLGD